MRRVLLLCLAAFVLIYLVPAAVSAALWVLGDHPRSWRQADWGSAAILPPANESREAALFVMAARTGGLKGAVAEHSWIVVKEPGGAPYERWDKVGWGSPVRYNGYPADGRWYSNVPRVVFQVKGEAAERLIPKVREAIRTYPYAMSGGYHIFPGPNSNTFTAFVIRSVPGLDAALPVAAVGRDYPSDGRLVSVDADGRDLRLSLFGYAGLAVGAKSGVELNILGLVAGLDLRHVGVKIPAFGTYTLLGER